MRRRGRRRVRRRGRRRGGRSERSESGESSGQRGRRGGRRRSATDDAADAASARSSPFFLLSYSLSLLSLSPSLLSFSLFSFSLFLLFPPVFFFLLLRGAPGARHWLRQSEPVRAGKEDAGEGDAEGNRLPLVQRRQRRGWVAPAAHNLDDPVTDLGGLVEERVEVLEHGGFGVGRRREHLEIFDLADDGFQGFDAQLEALFLLSRSHLQVKPSESEKDEPRRVHHSVDEGRRALRASKVPPPCLFLALCRPLEKKRGRRRHRTGACSCCCCSCCWCWCW